MTTLAAEIPDRPPAGQIARLIWTWRRDRKFELRAAWMAVIVFYNIFTIAFFVMSRTQPPPKAWWDAARIAGWFADNHLGLLWGFGIMFAIAALSNAQTALITYSIRRMSVSPLFAYAYLIIYSLAAVPGMLLTCIVLVVGAMRPDRDPQILNLLYDAGFLSFSGTMGIFLIGSLVWGVAILIDRNGVLPKWFGYLNLCNALTEVVVATCCVLRSGPFAWNGAIAFYVNMVVLAVYMGAFITLLRQLIDQEDATIDYLRNWPERS